MKTLLILLSILASSALVSADEYVRMSDKEIKLIKTQVTEHVFSLEALQRGRQELVEQIAEIDELIATIKDGSGR